MVPPQLESLVGAYDTPLAP